MQQKNCMSKIIRSFRDSSIKTKIAWCFVTSLLATVLFILICVTMVFTRSFMTQKNDLLLVKMSVIAGNVEDKVDYIQNFALRVKNDSEINYDLKFHDDNLAISERLSKLSSGINGVRSVFIVDKNNRILNNFYDQYKSLILSQIIQPFSTRHRENVFSSPNNFPGKINNDYMNNYYITYTRQIRENDTHKNNGYLVMSVSRDFLFSGLKPLVEEFYNHAYIVSKDGKIIYHVGDSNAEIDKNIVKLSGYSYLDHERTMIGSNTYFKVPLSNYPEWSIIGVVSERNLRRGLYNILITIVLVGFAIVIPSIIAANRLSRKITEPILNLNHAMQSFQNGEVTQKIKPTANDEVGHLVEGFNSMMDEIAAFIKEIEDKQEDKKKAEIAALKFQLELLQSQINPHFLYNTLNTVSFLAMKNRTSEIRDLIQSLNMLLRATITNLNQFITIKDEIEFLKAYVRIQNYRYENIIDLSFNVDSEALEYLIPKLILQPIVENALLHGIFPKEENSGHIMVTITCFGSGIDIAVADDGVGMDFKTIQQIRKNMRSSGFNNIGISNVNDRLQLYYGKASKLTIESVQGVGTVVTMQIPKHLLEEDLFGKQ